MKTTTPSWMERPVHWLADRPFPGSWRVLALAARYSRRLQDWPCRISDETLLTVNLRDQGASSFLRSGGLPHEAGLRRVLERFLLPGGCFWDVGANYGYYTGIFSEPRYQQSQVVAFEPNPKLVDRLTRDMLPRGNVVILAAAVGTADGHAELHIPMGGTGCGSLRPMRGENVKVRVRSIDSLLAEGRPPPNVMKIDVEGWEAAVLDGFQRKAELKPVIHFEHIEWAALEAGSSFERMMKILSGWRIYRVEEDGGLRATGLEHPRTTNDLIAIHPEDERVQIAESLVKDYR